MPFNSIAYVLLLAASCLWVAVLPGPALGLILASLLFYVAAGAFVTFNWLIQIAFSPERWRWRILMAVAFNMGMIGFFKYRNLLIGDVGHAGSYIDTALPLGISFYSLQALAYHVDVARAREAPARSFPEFFLFKAFFPQLIAGPIVRVRQLLPQIQQLFQGKLCRHRLLIFGLTLIVTGLIKKVVLADSIAPSVDEIFAGRPDSSYLAWLGAILFTFQIYFDFSGYSDIAIGSAYLLGIRLPWNFRTPYVSVSPREFWQRWHISLSTWIRDYLYIPLGGGHGHPAQTAAVLIVTMSLAGLWHGANYTFILWGACWGLYILLGRMFRLDDIPGMLWWPAHMLVVVALWVFFRSPSLDYALHYLETMFTFRSGAPAPVDDAAPLWQETLGMVGLFALHWVEFHLQRPGILRIMRRVDGPLSRGLLAVIAVLLILIPSANQNPFIYFRF
jgi:alginate O-acetyltransferase complex protein AlgI